MNANDFPDSDEEYDLVPTEVYKNSKNVIDTQSQNKVSQSNTFTQSQLTQTKSIVNGKGRTLTSKADDFPNFDEELDLIETNVIKTNSSLELKNTVENTRKRTADEFYRDVSNLFEECRNNRFDDDFEYEDRRDKRPRWDQPELLIAAIRNKRIEIQNKFENDHDDVPRIFHSSRPDKKENSITLRIPSWNFVPLTRYRDSQRLYVRLRPEPKVNPIKITSASGLLSTSYEKLKKEADQILLEKAKYDDLTIISNEKTKIEDKLWVDKYRPQKYLELLTEETVNLDFLRWMKSWDKVVFNREPKRNKHVSVKASNQPKKMGFGPNKFKSNQNNWNAKNTKIDFVDNQGLPVFRVALLSGPPGLGKTTLAHLVARHAGYNVVEINASDDRSPEAFRQALLSSTQMKSMIGADPRPNCLVLDEIDGAPAASIELLLKFIQGKLVTKGKKAKPGKHEECKRPIVCICNELYSAALRPLRSMAYVINVPKIDPSSLADRLLTIARKERINISHGALLQLAERCGCDVRSCLNSLQYMREDCQKSNTSLGTKDTKKGLFEFWRDILQIPVNKTGPLTMRERAQMIIKSASSNNSERIVQGIFENYPNNCQDKMSKISKSIAWFPFYDEISTHVMTKNNWQIMPYTNYAFVSWHFGLATSKNPKLNFPYTMAEVNQKLAKNRALITTTQRSYGSDIQVITLDIAPLLFELLTPKLRPVASNLFSTREKMDLERLLNVMLDLGLSYVQEKKEDGSMSYELEPNLYEIGIFPDCKNRKNLSYTIKQVIAQELEIARLKRATAVTTASSTTNTTEEKKSMNKNDAQPSQNTDKSFRPNHIDDMARVISPQTFKEKKYKDFFKNFKLSKPIDESLPNPSSEHQEHKTVSNNGVWFKYKEGYSNAVRRAVRIKDIL
ncbi:chromosome transmission fidelity protein 18 homolog [Chelonus insularis]|uniref:chromosome transmission fidelity protein 18 homolog n=1 Tax=Chelonus insularis TaxID=460826 RepID=UPI001589A2A3|nr:chromosome transmission fidelity protein 18 homolog [Chelonus insularis]